MCDFNLRFHDFVLSQFSCYVDFLAPIFLLHQIALLYTILRRIALLLYTILRRIALLLYMILRRIALLLYTILRLWPIAPPMHSKAMTSHLNGGFSALFQLASVPTRRRPHERSIYVLSIPTWI